MCWVVSPELQPDLLFAPLAGLDVCFVDADEASEGAVDSGGPSREFFRLLIRQFLDSPIFEGGDEKAYVAIYSW